MRNCHADAIYTFILVNLKKYRNFAYNYKEAYPAMKQRLKYTFSLVFAILVFQFWCLVHPYILTFHEQNQLFLFTSDYLMQRVAVAGGFTDYLSEFLVQFFFYPAVGAAIVALLLTSIHLLTWALAKQYDSSYVLSFLPALLLLALMGDENVMLSYPVSIAFVLMVSVLCNKFRNTLVNIIAIIACYWLAGPVFVVMPLLLMDGRSKRKKALIVAIYLAIAVVTVLTCRYYWVSQYPWPTVLNGINYYRLTLMTLDVPTMMYVVPLAILLAVFFGQPFKGQKQKLVVNSVLAITMVVVAFMAHSQFYDPAKCAIFEQNHLVRGGKWQQIIDRADQLKKDKNPMVGTHIFNNSLNLALAMTNQLPERMFEYPQTGVQGLLEPWIKDNITCVTTMEAFYRLGFINESLRYAFDLQESILNCRKSCRFTQRMAECNIINGKYDVASKYIDILSHTLFYRKWAERANRCLYNEELIATHPQWATLRQMRLNEDFFYNINEMHKMLGKLVLHNRSNQMALDYFMAQLLLMGDYRSYVVNLPQEKQRSQNPLPNGYQQYYEKMQKQMINNTTDATTSASSLQN